MSMVETDKKIDLMLEAADDLIKNLRKSRKNFDLEKLYRNTQRYLKTCWRQQSQDFMEEFKTFANDFSEAAVSRLKLDRALVKAMERGTSRLASAIRKEIEEGLRRGAASAMTDISGIKNGVIFDMNSPGVQRWIDKRVDFLTDSINATSRSRLTNLVTKLADEGKTYGQIGKAVRSEIRSWHTITAGVENRSQLISFTEMGQGYEQGRLFVREQAEKIGLRLEKRWILVADSRTCPECESAVEDWIPVSSLFANGYDAPLAHPGCRCDMVMRVAA